MTIENSDLNTSGALKSSNAGLTGGSGTGNRLVIADLQRGYTSTPPDDGIDMTVIDFNDGGFLGRPHGWDR